MPNTQPSYLQNIGDAIGLPGMAGVSAWLARQSPALARFGLRGLGSLAASPLTGALTAAQVMRPTPANAGEIPFYVKDPSTGQMVPNPQNPMVHSPALMQQNLQPPQAPPSAQPQPGTPPMAPPVSAAPAAPAAPTPPPSMPGGVPPPRPMMGAQGAPMSLTPPTPPLNPAPPQMGNNPFYNGPGSMSFGSNGLASGNQGPDQPNAKALIAKFMAMLGGPAPSSSANAIQ